MLKDLVAASRSYRSFDPSVTISKKQLLDFVDVARLCPSSSNLQMLKFRLVYQPEECRTVLENTRWAGRLKDVKLPPEGHEPAAYIVICTDNRVVASADHFLKDVGIAAQTIMLAAAEAGLGGCMIGSFAGTIKDVLNLPAGVIPQLILALGKPDENVEISCPAQDGSVTYFRNDGVHYVQKRYLKDLVL